MKHLAKWQRNQVFEAIQSANLDPQDFKWDDEATDIFLRHRVSPAYFVFGGDAGTYLTRRVVDELPAWELPAYSWDSLIRSVELWLADVKRDVDTPDLWHDLWQQGALLKHAADEALQNTPLTTDERDEIVRQLNHFRETAKDTYSLSEEQLDGLDSKLAYLIDAIGRLGRKDWLWACVGAMVGYFLSAALPPDASRDIFGNLLGHVARFFGLGMSGLGRG